MTLILVLVLAVAGVIWMLRGVGLIAWGLIELIRQILWGDR